MYSERDAIEIIRRIRKYCSILLPVLAALVALAALGYVRRVQWLAMGALALTAAAACFGLIFYLIPCLRYRGFLADMEKGLSREMVGSVVSVSEDAEPQDGALVLPVHILLTDDQDERIVYLNASKRELMPPPGTEARFRLYGRHIREIVPVEKG